jgi:hypothetical protein
VKGMKKGGISSISNRTSRTGIGGDVAVMICFLGDADVEIKSGLRPKI